MPAKRKTEREIAAFAAAIRHHLTDLGEEADVETSRYGDTLHVSICPIINGDWKAGPALLYRSDLEHWDWGTYGRVPEGEDRWTPADLSGHASAEEVAHHFADNMR